MFKCHTKQRKEITYTKIQFILKTNTFKRPKTQLNVTKYEKKYE